MSELLLDRAGRRRSLATMPAFTPVIRRATRACAIRPIRPRVEEIIAVMRAVGDDEIIETVHGRRQPMIPVGTALRR